MSRIYCIPDIHGRFDLLSPLMEKLIREENLDLSVDKLIFLGDLIDRGEDSKGVLDFIRELTELYPNNVVALAGNHEWLCIDAHIKPNMDTEYLWHVNGGGNTLNSFAIDGYVPKKLPEDYIRWMAFLPLKHEEPGFFFSHAPVPKESYRNIMYRGTTDFQPEELIWTYNPDEWGVARDHKNGVIGVSGHIHQLSKGIMKPRFYDHHYYLDSGCGCSAKAPLVAVEIASKKVIYMWPKDLK